MQIKFKFKMREKVRDQITGFEGIVTGLHSWITGCNQCSITPPAKDGELKDAHIFDETRLEKIGDAPPSKPFKATLKGCDQTIKLK